MSIDIKSAMASGPGLPIDDSHLPPEQKAAMMKVARQFESILVNQMVGAMRKTVTPNGFIPQSHAEKVYQSMLDNEHATILSDTDQIGLSKLVYEQLLRTAQGR